MLAPPSDRLCRRIEACQLRGLLGSTLDPSPHRWSIGNACATDSRSTGAPSHDRHRPHHRFRQPGDAADRPARARAGRLFRDRALQQGRGSPRAPASPRRSSSPAAPPASPSSARRARPTGCSRPACRCSASATASRPWWRRWAAGSKAATIASSAAPSSRSQRRARCSTASGRRATRDTVWMSHGDRVTRLPPGFKVVGVSKGAPFAAIADEKRKLYAVQFHPEVAHTPRGGQLIGNFVRRIAGLPGDWSMAHFRSSRDRQDPRPGRQGPRHLRPVGRRRQRGGRRADPRGDRRPAHLHLRRPRPAAARTRPRRWCRCSAATSTFRWCTSMPASASSRRSPASPTPRPSARPSARCSSTCSTRRPRSSAAPSSWPRARSIPT